MVTARITLDNYSNRVLNVIKAKFGLSDKSAALNKLIELHGDEYVEREVDEKYLEKLASIEEKHFKKNKKKTITLKELDELCGVQ